MDQLAKIKGGVYRNLMRRALILQDEPWWKTSTSPWKITVEHNIYPDDQPGPDYWFNRALDLCSIDLVHQNFGVTLDELMHMEVPVFIAFEKRVHEIIRRKNEMQDPELRKEMNKK